MPRKANKKAVPIQLDENLLAQLDVMLAETDYNRSGFVGSLIYFAVTRYQHLVHVFQSMVDQLGEEEAKEEFVRLFKNDELPKMNVSAEEFLAVGKFAQQEATHENIPIFPVWRGSVNDAKIK
jgi:hypothetical protein